MPLERLTLESGKPVEIWVPDSVPEDRPLFIFAHGSGNDMHSPFLETISGHLSETVSVVRFNFPYKVAGGKMPDRAEILMAAWRAVIDWVQANLKYSHLFLGGKSMGGRIATMVVADYPDVAGLIFLGYPLHPAGKFSQIRDEYLLPLRLPMLFVQGTRDALARMDLLQDTLGQIRDYTTLHWVEGGDHSFKVLVRQGVSYPKTLAGVSQIVAEWVGGIVAES